jgi:hypothetical protein
MLSGEETTYHTAMVSQFQDMLPWSLGREEGEEKALRQETIQGSVSQTRVQASLCSTAQFLHPFMTCE